MRESVRWGEKNSQLWVTLFAILFDFIALIVGYFYLHNAMVVAIAAAALGGFIHEIAQSGGSVAYPTQFKDGLYLGSLFGFVLGLIAGLLAIEYVPMSFPVTSQFAVQMFFTGLGLKGLSEAFGGQVKPS